MKAVKKIISYILVISVLVSMMLASVSSVTSASTDGLPDKVDKTY